MREMKRFIGRSVMVSEIVIVIGIYFFGSHGLQAYLRLRHENEMLHSDVTQLESEVASMQEEYILWQKYAEFRNEKIAREQLHMARRDEVIYYSA